MSHSRQHVLQQVLHGLAAAPIRPWRKPWLPDPNDIPPKDALVGLPFRGEAAAILRRSADQQGFSSRWWTTEPHWKWAGFWRKRRQEGTLVGPSNRPQLLFNAAQVEGVGVERFQAIELVPSKPTVLERLAAAIPVAVKYVAGDEAAYYRTPQDFVVMPLKRQFMDGPGHFFGLNNTLAHELAHATERRLGWMANPLLTITRRQAIGEFRAELASLFLAADLGLATDIPNSVAYLAHHGADADAIVEVAPAASAAADYLLAFARR